MTDELRDNSEDDNTPSALSLLGSYPTDPLLTAVEMVHCSLR